MSEENKNEDVVPVAAENNDVVATEENTIDLMPLIEKYEEAVAEQEARLNAPENVISSGAGLIPAEEITVQAMTAVENGVIGTGTVIKKAKPSAKKQEAKSEKVAIFSTKNVTWSSVGKVYRGYNLVSPEQAEKWLTRSHIRTVTPEELAKARENNN
jgi:hypothetical protein